MILSSMSYNNNNSSDSFFIIRFPFLLFPTGKCDFVGLGVNCDYYHAGLGIKERKRVHQLFIRDEIQVIFASFFFSFFLLIYSVQ